MANITRYSPFDESFDELFRGFFVRPVNFEGPTNGAVSRRGGREGQCLRPARRTARREGTTSTSPSTATRSRLRRKSRARRT